MTMSAYTAGAGVHLQHLVLDEGTNVEQKVECLKLLKIVIKNLADPVKAQDPKFRQLKMDNPKVQGKILPFPSATEYLKAVGFQQDGVVLSVSGTVDVAAMQSSLQEVTNALEMVTPKQQNSLSNPAASKRPRVVAVSSEPSSTTTIAAPPSRFTEKQKARILKEKKEQEEKDAAKAARKKTAALIKQDKYVRENDPNWKSKPSAACAKSGSSISTFRDRHGE